MYKKQFLQVLLQKDYVPQTIRELTRQYKFITLNIRALLPFIDSLVKNEIVTINDDKLTINNDLIIGSFDKKGEFGFVIPFVPNEVVGKDLYIHKTKMNGAVGKDIVAAKIIESKYSKAGKLEGKIVCIISESNDNIVGTFRKNSSFGFVTPDQKALGDIFIPLKKSLNAKDDDKVVVNIIKRATNDKSHEGEIVEIIGNLSEAGIEIEAMVKNFNIDQNFPDAVIKESEAYATEIPQYELQSELKHRRDLRDKIIITIDGDDTKDFDDAISIEKNEKGNYLLGVHIADVSYYVTENSALDKEALTRGTSIYLVDRVIPMLPKRLSNGICSLNPKVDRFTLSCEMEINHEGDIVKSDIFESVIKSTERMTYNDVNKIIALNDPELIEKYTHICSDLVTMKELYRILSKKKQKAGAMNFDFPECKIKLDSDKKPIEINLYERNQATELIEQFMVICNEAVAEFFCKKNIPFLYRIHDKPSVEKFQMFANFMTTLGYPVSETDTNSKTLQKILTEFEDKPEKDAVNKVMLRSMAKAKYSTEEIGHFGLANEFYSHFTSPIRRYPDLQIHRIIREYIHKELNPKRLKHYKEMLPEVAKQNSEAELNAFQCEREVEDYKKCEFMKDKYGTEFKGKISGVTDKGLFVELENTVEGFLYNEELNKKGVYEYVEDAYCYRSSSDKYTFGTEVTVELGDVDMSKKKITFILK